MGGGLKLIQTRHLQESPGGTKVFFYLRKPDVPITEEFTSFMTESYNQVAASLRKLLERDVRE